MTKIVFTLVIIILSCTGINAQAESTNDNLTGQYDCSQEYSFHFTRFGNSGTINSDESNDRVWVEFKNTSKKNMTVKAADTQISMDYLNGKGQEVTIYYEVVEKAKCLSEDRIVQERPIGYTRRNAYHVVTLKPGQTLEINVDKRLLSKGRAIYFSYDISKGKRNTTSRLAYFFEGQLPRPPAKPKIR